MSSYVASPSGVEHNLLHETVRPDGWKLQLWITIPEDGNIYYDVVLESPDLTVEEYELEAETDLFKAIDFYKNY